jgi:hypothetical protein
MHIQKNCILLRFRKSTKVKLHKIYINFKFDKNSENEIELREFFKLIIKSNKYWTKNIASNYIV